MRPDSPSLASYRRVLLLVPMFELAYRMEAIIYGLIVVSRIFLFYVLWSAIYQPGQVSGGMTLDQAITYSTLAALLVGRRDLWFDNFSDRIREGTIVYLFLRPLSPLRYYWAQNAGGIVYRLFWMIAGAAVAIAIGLILPPAGPMVLFLTIVSLLLAECVFGFFALFLELAAFWTIEIRGVAGVYFFALQLLSGALVPIWFFPAWARHALLLLPFTAAASTPVSLYVGRITPAQALPAIGLQLAWLVALAALGGVLWRRAERRVLVQGG